MPDNITSKNIVFQDGKTTRDDRVALQGHLGCVIWITGLSGSGKSTIATLLEEKLIRNGSLAYVLDGDNVRHGLNRDLGFSAEDRGENIRRIGEISALFAQAGLIVICSFISPYASGRQGAREASGDSKFIEVFLDTPLSECEKRDPKGLYKKVRAGEISNFTGVDAPYEQPVSAELALKTHQMTPVECSERIFSYLRDQGIFVKDKYL